ncbi:MAG: type III-B CRISPR module-associated protein Cmr5 [Cocleimonas sp.]|nr:type III-B CRISPR module-associated protein Cmr5 [Cocleimonas sp.]
MQTLQQQRAQYALTVVKTFAEDHPNDKKKRTEYKSYAAALPAMIHMNGLGQAAAFFKSKGGRHDDLYEVISLWLCCNNQPFANYDDLLKGITNADMQTYRLAQAEAQALMDWVKKFAKAYLKED